MNAASPRSCKCHGEPMRWNSPSWVCAIKKRARTSAAQKRYLHTEKGRDAQKRYQRTPAGRETQARYEAQPHRQLAKQLSDMTRVRTDY